MLINLSELFVCTGKEKNYNLVIDLTHFALSGKNYKIVDKEPVALDIRNLGDRKLFLQGKARFSLMMPCDRCLAMVKVPFDFEIERELDLNQSEKERVDALDEQPYISGYNLDVDQLVCDELLVNLPMKVLCKEDCKGICNRCGANLNQESCQCDRTSLDPRMSVIQDIFKQFKEV